MNDTLIDSAVSTQLIVNTLITCKGRSNAYKVFDRLAQEDVMVAFYDRRSLLTDASEDKVLAILAELKLSASVAAHETPMDWTPWLPGNPSPR